MTSGHRGLGHLAIQFASAMGFRTIALSSDGSKEQMARTLGADDFVDGSKVDQVQALQKLGGMRVIMATAPNARITENLIDALAINGTLLVLAVEPQPMKISPSESFVYRTPARSVCLMSWIQCRCS